MFGLPEGVVACLFDLDGVLTDTARLHTTAWAEMFDGYLRERARADGTAVRRRSTPARDYQEYVDGKPREDGVRSFLESRAIDLPEGEPDDGRDAETVAGLGNRKNRAVPAARCTTAASTVFEGSRRYLQAVSDAGLAVAVVSSSANTQEVLEATGLDAYVAPAGGRRDHPRASTSRGKPAPDSFLRGAELLGVPPGRAAVFEDAVSGVTAGRAGAFGLVVGVDRVGHAEALRRHGADVVVEDLAELL